MLKTVRGDILLSKADAIAHGVAPNDHFNQGLALSLRERWPAMAKDFRHWCHNTHPKTGNAWIWSGPGGTRIVNLLTQEGEDHSRGGHPGRAKLEDVNHALKSLRKIIQSEGLKSVALPKVATGVGGLEWSDVQPLIEQHLGDLNIPIYIYSEYHKGETAEEG